MNMISFLNSDKNVIYFGEDGLIFIINIQILYNRSF